MLYYQTKFVRKLTSSLEDTTKIVIFQLYRPSLWPWHWRFFFVSWCFKPSQPQRITSGLKYDSFYFKYWTVDSLATKLGLMIHCRSQSVLWKKLDYCFQGQGHSEGSKCRFLSGWYLLNHQPFCFKLGIVMHQYELECHAKRLICYFQGQGYCKSSHDQNVTISSGFFELLILLLPNEVW